MPQLALTSWKIVQLALEDAKMQLADWLELDSTIIFFVYLTRKSIRSLCTKNSYNIRYGYDFFSKEETLP